MLLLVAIAVLPLALPRWWHLDRNRALIAALAAAPIAILLLIVSPGALLRTLHEYLSFVILLGSLFTVSGGIVLRGDIEATPRVNAAFLALGALIANLIGTTGASMLLIHPLLRTNRERRRTAHIPLFFILIVSNAGGMLTPLGDPPLFLGYLRGVPFLWTLRLWPIWALANGWLLALFLAVDTWNHRRETPRAIRADRANIEPLRLKGLRSLPLFGLVIAGALLPSPFREATMIAAAAAAYFMTPAPYHRENQFHFGPIREVAILFAGIFISMVPALARLHHHGASLGLREPWQFFLVTGALSSILDNAPTYLSLLSLAQGLGPSGPVVGLSHLLLAAISAGAVLMGANTYIGNGPNFMVKAIVEHRGARMPSFLGFALSAVAILLPVYIFLAVFYFR